MLSVMLHMLPCLLEAVMKGTLSCDANSTTDHCRGSRHLLHWQPCMLVHCTPVQNLTHPSSCILAALAGPYCTMTG